MIRWIPGDPITVMLGDRGGDPEMIAELKSIYGLDRPLISQYFQFLGNLLRMDLGKSILSHNAVLDEFTARFPATVELGLVALVWSSALGIILGVLAAVFRRSFLDYSLMGVSLVGYSMPIFWWGLLLILFFSVLLGWLPVSGRMSVMYDIPEKTGFLLIDSLFSEERWPAFWDAVKHLTLPALALGTIPLAAIARMTRSSLLEVLKEDYIRTAKAKGLGVKSLIFKHALKNALTPIITVIGLMLGALLTGAILTETIFSWPGIGRWIVQAVNARDYPVIQGGVLLVSLTIILVNILVDSLYFWVNPTLRK
ncbi:MAG: ABC transporter permease [Bdellovibrionales bacterium]|nr:ABC transporter permease [Bdellovibrionales bacterium]